MWLIDARRTYAELNLRADGRLAETGCGLRASGGCPYVKKNALEIIMAKCPQMTNCALSRFLPWTPGGSREQVKHVAQLANNCRARALGMQAPLLPTWSA